MASTILENTSEQYNNVTFATTSNDSNGLDLLLVIYMGAMCLLCMVGNILVIVTIVKTKKLQTITSLFLANLAVADLCLGLSLMPVAAEVAAMGEWRHSMVRIYLT